MPTILEYSKSFLILKTMVKLWCQTVGGWLKLDSFLLSKRQDDVVVVQQPNNEVIVDEAAVALLENNEQTNNDNSESTSTQNLINESSIEDNLSRSTNNVNLNQEVIPEPLPEVIQQPDIPPIIPLHQRVAQAQQQRQENHLAARHQALLMMRDVLDYEDYERPNMFALRIIILLILLSITAVTISFLLFLVPGKKIYFIQNFFCF